MFLDAIADYAGGEVVEMRAHCLQASFAEFPIATGSDAVLDEGFAPLPVAQPAPFRVTETVEALFAVG